MYSKKILVLLLLFVFQQAAKAQDSMRVAVACDRVPGTDSLWITAQLNQNSKPGSLMVVAKAEDANVVDTMYYPLISVVNNFLLVLPEAYTNNSVTVKAFYYPGIFQITGVVHNRKPATEMLVFLFARNNTIYNKIVDINDGKGFILPRLIFENKASLFFNYADSKHKQKPDISIKQFPAAADFKDSVLSAKFDFKALLFTSEKYDSLKAAGQLPPGAVRFEGKGKELQQIVVTGNRKTKLEKFKDEYVTPRFSDIMEKEYDCLTNDDILHFSNCIMYLQSKVPNLMLGNDAEGGQSLFWRNEKIRAYYIDEIEVDFTQLQILDVNSIAVMKLLPPTLFGSSMNGGNGGVVAVYTRKGEYVRQGNFENNWLFSVQGYTPAVHTLFSKDGL